MNVQGTTPRPVVRPEAVASPRPAAPAAGDAPASAPAKAGDAREAALWDVLTPEERDWFAQQAQLGPLTYGRPAAASAVPAPRGQRLDVRG